MIYAYLFLFIPLVISVDISDFCYMKQLKVGVVINKVRIEEAAWFC